MKKRIHRWVALLLIGMLLVNTTLLSAFATADPISGAAAETEVPANDIQLSDSTAGEVPVDGLSEWEDTGELQDDGSPVTSDEGDVFDSTEDEPVMQEEPQKPEEFLITVDLDGGQVNGMQGAGWTQASNATYRWERTVIEETAGQGCSVAMDDTLGGLLPEMPYRSGYEFQGWQIDEEEKDGTVTITDDTTIQAIWQETTYKVTFQGDGVELWTVEVPYGATFWSDSSQTPWLDENVEWIKDQENPEIAVATVEITVGGTEYSEIAVTRHPVANDRYYYTFTADSVFYFTYGGEEPTKAGCSFTAWKLTSGGSGFTVLEDAVFTAQFEAGVSYVFQIYYYYSDGTRADAATSYTLSKDKIDTNGKLIFTASVPDKKFYTASWKLQDGVTVDNSNQVTVDVETVFGDSVATTYFLALTVEYAPAEVSYTVEYYQQNEAGDDYTQVGAMKGAANYGSLVSVADKPALEHVSFEGFEVRADSRSAVHAGVLLQNGSPNVEVTAGTTNTATVRVYYDRVSYFIYFQTGTTEVQLEPLRVRYGDEIPSLQESIKTLQRTGYKAVQEDDLSWYHLGNNGQLEEEQGTIGTMPAYDLYVVVKWTPDTTSIRIVYWVESRNASDFQNAYTTTIENVKTEATLTVTIDNDRMSISGGGIQDEDAVDSGFEALISSKYNDRNYKTFFSLSADKTKSSPGNVQNAQATGTGDVQDGKITADSFEVKVSGDGSTTVNVYYTRNLYTLEFVLARKNTNGTIEVATNTPGTFVGSGWTNTSSKAFDFTDFTGAVTATQVSETYGTLNVTKKYQLTDAKDRDPRSAVGRYGTKTINGYTCYVYTLTARFEADITALWPTADNIDGAYDELIYVSMGTYENSYYRVGHTNGNILNAYSTMDLNVVATGKTEGTWTATADQGNGTVAHQMVAYWYWTDQTRTYQYYFLMETLDTTLNVNSEGVVKFSAESADKGEYSDNQLVAYKNKVYVFNSKSKSSQNSTHSRGGQNPPARQGFISAEKDYSGNAEDLGGNIYFFYTRETYTLDIQNVDGRYTLPNGILTQSFNCLNDYAERATTLQQLGWEKINSDGTATIRYGGHLKPIQEQEIVDWLLSDGKLEYPYQTAGENQYYFNHWFQNAQYTVTVDWTTNEMETMYENQTLYAGWFAPRYTTSYVLNGGSWEDSIDYTLMAATIEGQAVFLYYQHLASAGDPLYWYVQTKADDRLYVGTLYETTVDEVLIQDASTGHWKLQDGITMEKLPTDTVYKTGSRLVDHYFCYMGDNGLDESNNHNKYVSINAQVNSVLPEPKAPIRNGYTFAGWYYFDANEAGEKVYLKDVLADGQSVNAYGDGYVYLDNVADAHLLYADAYGDLFYYENQIGYRFSYTNEASVVSQTRELYAAWTPSSDAKMVVYHLVPINDAQHLSSFTVDQTSIPLAQAEKLLLGGTEYYVLKEDTEKQNLTNGTVQFVTAWEFCTDNEKRRWLPEYSAIDLQIGDTTPTVDSPANAAGNAFRIQENDGTYTYYACLVYKPTKEVNYSIYAIDLSAAVAEGALQTYQDTFDRNAPPDVNAPYVLQVSTSSWNTDAPTSIVTENAPAISGYTIYEEGVVSLQLQAKEGNNIYFYYVKEGEFIQYDITYYLMRDGTYSDQNRLVISDIPAVQGEILSLADLTQTYQRLLKQAQTFSGYSSSDNPDFQELYDRYKEMTITMTQGGASQKFTVDAADTDSLDLNDILHLLEDYYQDGYSPSGETAVISDGTALDVYMGMAELRIQKVNGDGQPLQGAQFTLERLRLKTDGDDPGSVITYDEMQYVVDEEFVPISVESDSNGRALFQNLSAQLDDSDMGYLYRLTETKSPSGYYCPEEPIFVTTPYTVAGETSYQVSYTISNYGISYLPKAGVFGGVYTTIFLGTGICFAAIGCGILCFFPGRKRRRTHQTGS